MLCIIKIVSSFYAPGMRWLFDVVISGYDLCVSSMFLAMRGIPISNHFEIN